MCSFERKARCLIYRSYMSNEPEITPPIAHDWLRRRLVATAWLVLFPFVGLGIALLLGSLLGLSHNGLAVLGIIGVLLSGVMSVRQACRQLRL